MGEHIKTGQRRGENRPVSLGELIHAQVRRAIELAVEEELAAALGATRYERGPGRVSGRPIVSDRGRAS